MQRVLEDERWGSGSVYQLINGEASRSFVILESNGDDLKEIG